ncbi:EF-P 5-aminopentanol modification-associated protein YfmF [Sporosarcina luteola]|uniref:EF-P 5-aminopentanol modification-associated protein YfmF n=1 Tax=Sporosarcina luteola TaxID=582850 RepID=UPI00203F0618|nr:pitrilysin family protein [Sporosarcina luteola]MCM3709880.1 insulinase family protein [Sporosarcina luteola]
MFTKVELQKGVNLYIRRTEQFKTITMSIKWLSELDEKQAAYRAVLSNVLQDSSADYPKQSDLRKALDELYGTVFYMDAGKRGSSHIISLNMECVNDEYLSTSGVFDEALKMMSRIIFNPNLKDGTFDESVVNREKRTVIERIRSIYDDKGRYAHKRMLELMRPNDPASMSASGTEKDVESITTASLLDTYKRMLDEDEIDIYIVGDVQEDELAEKVKSMFGFPAREAARKQYEQPDMKNTEARQVFERQDMKQGKLQVGYSTPVSFFHPDYPKMQVANGVLGGFAHSKLFMNVREKESMAYTVNSAYAAYYGIVYVMAGIDADLEEKAVKLIGEQIDALQNGNVSDLELDQTIALLTNSIRSAFDSARGQIELYDQYKQLDENFTADKWIAQWEAVSIEDVQQMASQIHLELIYLLSGREA